MTVYFGAAPFLVNHYVVPWSSWCQLSNRSATTRRDGPAFIAGILATALADGDRTDEARQLLAQFAAAGFELPGNELWLTGMMTTPTPPSNAGTLDWPSPSLTC